MKTIAQLHNHIITKQTTIHTPFPGYEEEEIIYHLFYIGEGKELILSSSHLFRIYEELQMFVSAHEERTIKQTRETKLEWLENKREQIENDCSKAYQELNWACSYGSDDEIYWARKEFNSYQLSLERIEEEIDNLKKRLAA